MSTDLALNSKFKTSAVGLVATSKPTWGEWEVALSVVGGISRSCQWWLGDMLNLGQHTFGEKYVQAADALGFEYAYLKDLAYVCEHVQLAVRTDRLSFSHHKIVAPLKPEDQAKWLALAIKNDWTVAQLRAAINGKDDEEGDEVDEADLIERVLSIVRRVPEAERHELIAEIVARLEELDRGA